MFSNLPRSTEEKIPVFLALSLSKKKEATLRKESGQLKLIYQVRGQRPVAHGLNLALDLSV